MPITLTTAAHPPREWRTPNVSSAEELLAHSSPEEQGQRRRVIRSSFLRSSFPQSHISASKHGFVWAVVQAYSYHHNLILRPEDVWFSILTQLSFFVNAHAEELRSLFVSHEGQKELRVFSDGTINEADFGALAVEMTGLIEGNIVDPEFRAWMMPDFSTTTKSDTVVAAILMMGTLQKYFSYVMELGCGIPSVTLLGEREDWEKLRGKLDKLYQLGDEPARFAQLLQPILNNLVASFDHPDSPDVLDFWSRCAHKKAMSGSDILSGWVTVFCFWEVDGNLLYPEPIYPTSSAEFKARDSILGLVGALSRRIDSTRVPSGFVSVPVTVDDQITGKIYDTTMLAGLVGIEAQSSGVVFDGTKATGLDSIQPASGWWMYEECKDGPGKSFIRYLDPVIHCFSSTT